MSYIEIELFDPKFRSEYPRAKILVGNQRGYFVHNQIPLYFEIQQNNRGSGTPFPSSLPMREIFQASIFLSHKHFPTFVFPLHSPAYIHITTESDFTPEQLITKAKRIIDGDEKIPILYDPWETYDSAEAMRIIEQTRGEREYIDLFHSSQIPFPDLINLLSKSFEFSEIEPNHASIASFYDVIAACPRHIHISLYYLINAARLMRNFFVEDAAINLNLASEAIITDYMEIADIQNKKAAIARLLSEDLQLAEDKVEWYVELYEARNEFLAHIDNDMFTPSQNISDPDKYCYDHYEDIVDLIIGYIGLRKDLVNQKRQI